MKNRSFKYIFGLMLTSILLMVGCGSSSDNPVSRGNVDSGIVNVSGNVKNLNGNGSVSFYTPVAAARKGLNVTSSSRTSVANEGVYSFNVNENGNYSGQIPAGDYYLVAQNNDGTMKSVVQKQTYSSARAVTQDIVLTTTVDISGTIYKQSSSSSKTPIGGVPLYLEGLPFISVSDSEGKFVFKSVPTLIGDQTYTIKASVSIEGVTLSTEKTVGYSTIADDQEVIVTEGTTSDAISNIKAIKGYVYDDSSSKKPQPNKLVVCILESGKVISTFSEEVTGLFVLYLSAKEKSAELTANMVNFYQAEITPLSQDTYPNEIYTFESQSSGTSGTVTGFAIVEKTGSGFETSNLSTLTVFYNNEEYLRDSFYFPATYTVTNVPTDLSYWYMLESINYETGKYGYRILDILEVEPETFKTVTHNLELVISPPTINISNGNYTISGSWTHSGEADLSANIATFAYAIREGDSQPIDLGYNGNPINFDSVTENGVYEVYAGYRFRYNNHQIATITSNLCQCVIRDRNN